MFEPPLKESLLCLLLVKLVEFVLVFCDVEVFYVFGVFTLNN